jgi:plasmid stabilization system protein ParE
MKFLSTFNKSFNEAVDHYAEIDRKVARRFIKAVDAAQRQITAHPKAGHQIKKYRVVLIQGFPYSFCYHDDLDGEVVALVLFHHKQREPKVLDWLRVPVRTR